MYLFPASPCISGLLRSRWLGLGRLLSTEDKHTLTWCVLHSTLCVLYRTWCVLYSTWCVLNSTWCTVLYSTWFIVQYMVYCTVHGVLYSTWCNVHDVLYNTLCNVHYMVYCTVRAVAAYDNFQGGDFRGAEILGGESPGFWIVSSSGHLWVERKKIIYLKFSRFFLNGGGILSDFPPQFSRGDICSDGVLHSTWCVH